MGWIFLGVSLFYCLLIVCVLTVVLIVICVWIGCLFILRVFLVCLIWLYVRLYSLLSNCLVFAFVLTVLLRWCLLRLGFGGFDFIAVIGGACGSVVDYVGWLIVLVNF